MNKTVRTAAIAVLAAGLAGAVALLVIRDQMSRHKRDLFSPHAFRRLAALGHISRSDPSASNITLLRDFISWEPTKLLRKRARAVADRMERDARSQASGVNGATG